ncbi:hypothetical protein [Enterocloster bolteae]|jgi:hypothetical protein|uniref:hypothetical protein n=1 Tax=Enterocloster bolteae TaxID=208479 RepID=UPI003AEF5B07
MMRKQSSQMQMIILDIEAMIPERHLLRQIKNCVKRMPVSASYCTKGLTKSALDMVNSNHVRGLILSKL